MAKSKSEDREPVTIYALRTTKDRFQDAAREFGQQSDPFLNVLLTIWDGLSFEAKAKAVRDASTNSASESVAGRGGD